MRSAVLYGCKYKYSELYYPVSFINDSVTVWVRMEIFDTDITEALDLANPMPDEVVLNSMEIE